MLGAKVKTGSSTKNDRVPGPATSEISAIQNFLSPLIYEKGVKMNCEILDNLPFHCCLSLKLDIVFFD